MAAPNEPDADLTYHRPSAGAEDCKVCRKPAEVWLVRRGANVMIQPRTGQPAEAFDAYSDAFCLKHQPAT